MLQKILVPLDGSELAEKALPYAEALAQKFEAELILTIVLQTPTVPLLAEPYGGVPLYNYDEMDMTERRKSAQEYLAGVKDKLDKRIASIRTKVLENVSVADGIVDIAKQEKIDVIVKTTHGRSGPSRWIYGSVATKVLQQAPCPIFLVRVK